MMPMILPAASISRTRSVTPACRRSLSGAQPPGITSANRSALRSESMRVVAVISRPFLPRMGLRSSPAAMTSAPSSCSLMSGTKNSRSWTPSARRIAIRLPLSLILWPHRFSSHGNEPYGDSATLDYAAPGSLDDHHILISGPYRNDHSSPHGELIHQRLRHFVRGRGDEDRVERRLLGPAEVAVTRSDVDVRVAQLGENCARAFRELGN